MNTGIKNAVRRALALSAGSVLLTSTSFVVAQEEAPAAVATGPTEEVVVIGRQREAATEVIEERLKQEAVVDLMDAQQISKLGDSTVSLALRRLPGVTLVSDKFIYIRGLGERYSSTTLNGAYVPSPDLTRNVIPLDLFPAEIIDSLSISKGYTADMPAAFGGGNVDIRTTGIPDDFVLNFQVGSGWNSNSDSSALTYPGGDDDWKGEDDGTRALPGQIQSAIQTYLGDISVTGILSGLNRDGQPHSVAQAQQINRELATSLNRDIDFTEGSQDPDISAEAALGNSWYFGDQEQWRFGVIGLGDYKNQWRQVERITRSAGAPDTDFDNTQQTTNQVSVTGSLSAGLEYGNEQKVEVTGIYLRNTDDEASLRLRNNTNFLAADGRQLRYYGIRYEQRELELVQFTGSHTLGDDTMALLGIDDLGFMSFAKDLTLSWYYSDATAKTDLPNELTVSAIDEIDPGTGAVISTSVRSLLTSAEYRYTELEDDVRSSGWSLSKPFEFGNSELIVSGGQDQSQKGRSYLQTQLGLGTTTSAAQEVLIGTPGQVFTDENILDPANGFLLTMGGIGTESYLAAEAVDAAFLKADYTWNETWRVAAGVRWENFRQIAVPVNQYEYDVNVPKVPIPIEEVEQLIKDEDDYYPALALTWIKPDFWAETFQLRAGWSETTARPDLREVSPTVYIDPINDARVTGNPNLVAAMLSNFDIRAEWFFDSGDNLTVTAFYKDITDPIETVEGGGTDNDLALTFINAESAEVYGVEVEGFKSLEFLSDGMGSWIDGFFVAGNVTWSDSEIIIGQQAVSLTNDKRRMTQQADFVANVQLGYDSPNQMHSAVLAYNYIGERLFYAGRGGAQDAYEQPFNSLDLTYSFYPTDMMSIKLRAQNLLDETLEVQRSGVTTLEQNIGMTFKLDVGFKF